MTTVADLVEDALDHLYGGFRRQLNVLEGAMDASQLQVNFTHQPDQVAPGAFVSIDDELMYVVSVEQAAKQAIVIRGMRGTAKVPHADDALIDINPRFPRHRVKETLLGEIRSWPESVYRVETLDLDTSPGVAGVDLTGVGPEFYSILDVALGPRTGSIGLDVTRPSFSIVRDAQLSLFPSGVAIILTSFAPTEVRDLRVTVAMPFDLSSFDDTDDAVDDFGLAETMLDIPPIGAAWRLMLGRDVKRSFGEGQGDPRRAEEIPPGFAGSIATMHKRTRDARLSDEAIRLAGRWPLRAL